MKTLFFLILINVFFFSDSFSQQVIQNIKARNIQNLDGRWHYIVDPYENGFYNYRRKPIEVEGGSGYFQNKKQTSPSQLLEYDFEKSPTLNVPGDWNSQVEKLELYEGTVWYQRDFTVNKKNGKRYFLHFGAVNYESHVYVNGKKVGVHIGGFTPFQFEVTKELTNGNNFVVVKVDNTRKPENVPTVNSDWWNYGGITRDVVLAEMAETFIEDYSVQLAKSDSKNIEGFIQVDGKNIHQKVSVQIPEIGLQSNLTTNDSGIVRFKIPIKKLQYWSPENPKLYNVIITSETDTVKDKIGFRTIETKGKDILLNGKPVFLRGICIHEENPLIPGRARSKGDLKMLLEWAKELNCNYVRLAHYPHNEYMSQLADEMGLLVWEEVPVYWTIAWENAATLANAEQQLTDLIDRDKNRASVIIWSTGNETPLSEPRLKFMSSLADLAHSLDKTRLVSAALEMHSIGKDSSELNDELGNKLDVVSFNEYFAWYDNRKPADVENIKIKIDFNKPVIISETGADALGGFHANDSTKFSEEYQEAYYKSQLKMIRNIEGLRGFSPWILVDFRSPRRPHPVYQNFWNRKGIFTETGKKKKAFYVLKSFYDDIEKNKKVAL